MVKFSVAPVTLLIPFNICDKITPLLPLAPFKAPFAILVLTSLKAFDPQLFTSLAVLFKVKAIFVPVSPSGTGKTLRASIVFLLSSTQDAPAIIILLRVAPFIVLSIKMHFLQSN